MSRYHGLEVIEMRKLLPVALLVTLAAACGPPAAPPPGPSGGPPASPGGTVVIGLLSDIQGWNPYLAEDLDTAQLLALVYPTLAIEQPDYHRHPPSFAPALARAWAWSDDHLVLELELDPRARWSDGEPITARDVVFTWQVQTSDEVDWLHRDAKGSITAVEAVDDHTVRVSFSRVHPYQLMDLNDGPIVPAHAWSDIPFADWRDTDWLPLSVAGGPFRIAGHTPQQQITLERNPGYWGAPLPALDRVVFRIAPSEQSLVNQLLAGDIDMLPSLPPADLDRVRAHPGIEMVIYDDRSYTHICWNTADPRLADPAVRRALTAAIDRRTLIDVVYGGFGRPGVGPILSSFWAFDDGLEPLPHDPGAARAGLAAAGWSDSDGDGVLDRSGEPFTIELLAAAENELRQDIALLVQADLARVGVRVEPRFVEWGTLVAAVGAGEFDAMVNRWEEPTQIDLEGLWRTAVLGEPTFNFGRYSNAEVDRLLDEVAGLADFAAQRPIYHRIQRLVVADQPYTFLVENTRLTALASRIRGAEINSATPYFNLEEWTAGPEPVP
jgi:peptide/nickel transport system substrate-binding protein